MDIQYRNYYDKSDKYIDNGDIYVVGALQALETFLLDGQYRIIEGLIVDAVNGGIGIRNHTVPIGLDLGAEWTEDILWITPETACTPVNLSLHFSISNNSFSNTTSGYLQDDGGFANLDPDIPVPRWDGPADSWQDVFGGDPDLQHRSYTAAWWNNQFVANTMNISSSNLGDIYTEGLSSYAELASPSSITIHEMDGEFLNDPYFGAISSNGAQANNFTIYGMILQLLSCNIS